MSTPDPKPAAAFDALLDRATARLTIDPDLALDVRRELKTHLDAAAAEHRAGGLDESRAMAEASRDLGDPDALADDLYKANRSRIRLRSWAKWVGRIAALPALGLAIAALLLPGLISQAQLSMISRNAFPDGPIQATYVVYVKSRMTERQKLIVFGSAADLAERFPDSAMFQANYINTLIEHPEDWPLKDVDGDGVPEIADRAQYDRLTAALDRGETLDPDNGYYALLRAALLLPRAGSLVPIQHDDTQPHDPDAPPEPDRDSRLVIHDPAMYRRGLAQFDRAIVKPRLSTYAFEMERYRQEQIPPATRLMNLIYRQTRGFSVLLPMLGQERKVARQVAAYALRRAEAGDLDAAMDRADGIDRLATHSARDARGLIQLLVAESVHGVALETWTLALRIADRPEAARATWDRFLADRDFIDRLRDASPGYMHRLRRRGGALMNMLTPAAANYDLPWALPREAEYAAAEQALLGWALTAATLALGVMTLIVGVVYWKRRRRGGGDEPVLLWVGWRRLAVVLGLGVGLPGAVYLVLAWSPGWGSHRYGLNYAVSRVMVEWALVGIGMVVGTTHLGLRGIRGRAMEVGIMTDDGKAHGWPSVGLGGAGGKLVWGLAGVIVVTAGVFVVGWPWDEAGMFVAGRVAFVAGGIVAGMGVWLLLWLAWVVTAVKGVAWTRDGIARWGIPLGVMATALAPMSAMAAGVPDLPPLVAMAALGLGVLALGLAAGFGIVAWRWQLKALGRAAWMALIAATGLLVAAAVVWQTVVWQAVASGSGWQLGAIVLSVGVIAGVPAMGLWRAATVRSRRPRYSGSALRTLAPLLAGAVLLVAAVGGGSLRGLEAVRVGQLVDRGAFVWSEVEHTSWRRLRDRLAAQTPPEVVPPGSNPAPGSAPTPGAASQDIPPQLRSGGLKF